MAFMVMCCPVLPGESACLECMAMGTIEEKPPIPALGAVAGVIGSLQAMEAVKYVLGAGDLLTGKLLTYDALRVQFRVIQLPGRAADCGVCGKLGA